MIDAEALEIPAWRSFIERWGTSDDATELMLVRSVDCGPSERLETLRVDPTRKPDEQAVAAAWAASAQSAADALGRSCVCTAYAYKRRGASYVRLASSAQRFEPSGEHNGGSYSGEQAAIVGHTMRYLAGREERLERAIDGVMHHMSCTVERMGEELQLYRDDHLKSVRLVQDLLDRKATRDLEIESDRKNQARMDEALGMGKDLLSLFVAAQNGAGPLAELIRSIPEGAVQSFVGSLDERGQKAFRQLVEISEAGHAARDRLLELMRPKTSAAIVAPGSSPPDPQSADNAPEGHGHA